MTQKGRAFWSWDNPDPVAQYIKVYRLINDKKASANEKRIGEGILAKTEAKHPGTKAEAEYQMGIGPRPAGYDPFADIFEEMRRRTSSSWAEEMHRQARTQEAWKEGRRQARAEYRRQRGEQAERARERTRERRRKDRERVLRPEVQLAWAIGGWDTMCCLHPQVKSYTCQKYLQAFQGMGVWGEDFDQVYRALEGRGLLPRLWSERPTPQQVRAARQVFSAMTGIQPPGGW